MPILVRQCFSFTELLSLILCPPPHKVLAGFFQEAASPPLPRKQYSTAGALILSL